MNIHWLESAEYVYGRGDDAKLIGEDENGNLLAPSRTRALWWDERLNLRKPRHLLAYLRSRRRGRIVMLETGP